MNQDLAIANLKFLEILFLFNIFSVIAYVYQLRYYSLIRIIVFPLIFPHVHDRKICIKSKNK